MKSKVCLFSIVLVLFLNLYESKPTFGDEFVHIKVHLPKEGGEVHTNHDTQSIRSHSIIHARPPLKVVHHFHQKRRRPVKKTSFFNKHSGLLESIILSEVKKPISSDHYKYLSHAEDIVKHVDTLIAKPDKPKPQVETYKLIEETKPKQKVEHFNVIASKIPKKHQFHHAEHYYEQDIPPTVSFEDGYHYKSHNPVKTYKVIESLLDDYHTHLQDPNYQFLSPKKQRAQTIEIVDNHEQELNSYKHHDYGSQEYATHGNSYQYASNPGAETYKIVEKNAPHQHSQEFSFNFDKKPYSETVQVVKTHKPTKLSSYYDRHQQQQHFDSSGENHGYHYHGPDVGSSGTTNDGSFSVGYDYKAQTYEDTHRSIPKDHYAKETEDRYFPPKRPSSAHRHHNHKHSLHNHYHSNIPQNSSHSDETVPATDGAVTSFNESYLPPQLPTLSELDHGAGSDTTHWPQQDADYKVTETYSGIDSYSAAHVQGLGSGSFQYPSPYH